jgi:hypothetical protein
MLAEAVEEQETPTMQQTPYPESGIPQQIFEQPGMCAECGLQIGANQFADECELCGAPRCRACATQAGDGVSAGSAGRYICSACAADA